MLDRRIFVIIVLFVGCFLLYYTQIHLSSNINSWSRNKTSHHHHAVILARRPTSKILNHLTALVRVGVNAYVMCDENPSKYMNITKRILYVDDQSLARYGLKRNRVWDRVFLWLYNQTSIDYVWLMEDDLTWVNVQHMLNLFDKYANNPADLLARNIIYRNNQTLGWIWWPKSYLKLFPENKWSGSLNMLSRVSHRLIQAHQYYIHRLWQQRKENSSMRIDDNYYYQEFFTPTVAHLFNLTMVIYDHSNMEIHVSPLSEDYIRGSLANKKYIFHPVKHDSQLLSNATV